MSHSCLRSDRPLASPVVTSCFKPQFTAFNAGEGRLTSYKKYDPDKLYAAYEEVINYGVKS